MLNFEEMERILKENKEMEDIREQLVEMYAKYLDLVKTSAVYKMGYERGRSDGFDSGYQNGYEDGQREAKYEADPASPYCVTGDSVDQKDAPAGPYDDSDSDEICEIGLFSTTISNALYRGGYKNVGDLKKAKIEDLKKIKGLGRTRITEIREVVKDKYGIILK